LFYRFLLHFSTHCQILVANHQVISDFIHLGFSLNHSANHFRNNCNLAVSSLTLSNNHLDLATCISFCKAFICFSASILLEDSQAFLACSKLSVFLSILGVLVFFTSFGVSFLTSLIKSLGCCFISFLRSNFLAFVVSFILLSLALLTAIELGLLLPQLGFLLLELEEVLLLLVLFPFCIFLVLAMAVFSFESGVKSIHFCNVLLIIQEGHSLIVQNKSFAFGSQAKSITS